MPRTCTLCHHPNRDDIDRALLAGDSFRHIASQFGTSTTALQRHKADHLPKTLVKARAFQEVVRADSLLEDVRADEDRIEALYVAAEGIAAGALNKPEPDTKTALLAIRTAAAVSARATALLELRGRLTGELAGSELTPGDRALRVISVPKINQTSGNP